MESPPLRLHAAAAVYGKPSQATAVASKLLALDLQHIVRTLGAERDVETINQALVDSWQQQQIADGYCPATIDRRLVRLIRLLEDAHKCGAIKGQPRLRRSQALDEHMRLRMEKVWKRLRQKREERKLQQAR